MEQQSEGLRGGHQKEGQAYAAEVKKIYAPQDYATPGEGREMPEIYKSQPRIVVQSSDPAAKAEADNYTDPAEVERRAKVVQMQQKLASEYSDKVYAQLH